MTKIKKFKAISSLMAATVAISTFGAVTASAANKTESESNNTRATANTIYVNDTYTAKIGTSGDIDCFKFVPSVNDKIRVDLTNIPSGLKYNLWLQDNSGNALTSNTNTGTSKYITYQVTAGTPYYIVVNGSGTSNYSSSYSYKVSLKSINFKYLGSQAYSGGSTISVDQSSLGTTLSSWFNTARSNWSNAVSGVSFSSISSSSNKVQSGEYTDTWYGLYSGQSSGGVFKRFDIYINETTLDGASTSSNKSKYYISTMTHELGHALGLDDNPTTNANSLMKHGRDRAVIYTPQTFDVDAVKNNFGWVSLTSNTDTMSISSTDVNPDTGAFTDGEIEEIQLHSDYPEYEDLNELYNSADLVVVCRNIGNASVMFDIGSDYNSEIPYTISNVEIANVLKGDESLDSIKIKQLGGTFDDVRYTTDNVEQLNENDTYLLFLKTYDDAPASLLNPVQGMYYMNGTEVVSRIGNNIEMNMSDLAVM